MGPRIYTPREASALVPKLNRAFEEIDQIKARLKTIKGKVDVLEMIWGDEVRAETNPDHREYAHYMEEIEQSKKDFDTASKRFAEFEAVVKSVEQGLVDFYGVIENRLVFLCWRVDEDHITHWHDVDAGYAGRQPVDATFLTTTFH